MIGSQCLLIRKVRANMSGRPFNKFCTSAITVNRTSSVRVWFPMTALIALLHDCTKRSQIPPECGAAVGLKCHSIPCCSNSSLIFDWFQLCKQSRSSLSAPTKLVSLLEWIRTGFPFLAIP